MRSKTAFIVLAALVATCGSSWGQEATAQEVRIASGGHLVHFLPLDLALAQGFFEDEELEPEVSYLKGGTATAQALLASQVDFSTNSIDHAFKAAVQGKDNLRMVVLFNQTPGMVLVVSSRYKGSVRAIADLGGLRLGVTSKGSATHSVLTYLLHRSGVERDEYTVLDAGSSTFPAALDAGSIDGGIALEPAASTMVKQGKVFVLADLNSMEETRRAFGGPYNQAGILTREDVIRDNRALVETVVRVLVRALRWIDSHSPEEIADALPEDVVGTDRQRYIETLRKLKDFYSQSGWIDPTGVENVYESMLSSGALPPETSLSPNRYFTDNFVEQAMQAIEPAGPRTGPQGQAAASQTWLVVLLPLLVAITVTVATYLLTERRARHRDLRARAELEDQHHQSLSEAGRLHRVELTELEEHERKSHQELEKRFADMRRDQFVPLSGLDNFEDRICDMILHAEERVQLCLSTPLLHSLRGTWLKYDGSQLATHPSDHWAAKFCEPLVQRLQRRAETEDALALEVVYLDEPAMKEFLLIAADRVPFREYAESLDYFLDKLRSSDSCVLTPLQTPDVPIYMVIVDGPAPAEAAGGATLPRTAAGIVAFTSPSQLVAQHRAGIGSDEMARNLQAYEFSNHEVIRFFSRLFDEIAATRHEPLRTFIRQCRQNGFKQAFVCRQEDGTLVARVGYPDSGILPSTVYVEVEESAALPDERGEPKDDTGPSAETSGEGDEE